MLPKDCVVDVEGIWGEGYYSYPGRYAINISEVSRSYNREPLILLSGTEGLNMKREINMVSSRNILRRQKTLQKVYPEKKVVQLIRES